VKFLEGANQVGDRLHSFQSDRQILKDVESERVSMDMAIAHFALRFGSNCLHYSDSSKWPTFLSVCAELTQVCKIRYLLQQRLNLIEETLLSVHEYDIKAKGYTRSMQTLTLNEFVGMLPYAVEKMFSNFFWFIVDVEFDELHQDSDIAEMVTRCKEIGYSEASTEDIDEFLWLYLFTVET
jgi:hypothetical protein